MKPLHCKHKQNKTCSSAKFKKNNRSMKRKKYYKRLLTVVLYFYKEHLCKRYSYTMTQRQTTVLSFFQIKSTRQGKVTFLTFYLNSIFTKSPHIHKIRTPYFCYFIFMKHFSRLQLALPIAT